MNTPLSFLCGRCIKRRSARAIFAAFTLVEMLVVMAVIVIIIGGASPVISSLSGAGDVNKSVYDIAGLLEQSRAYAMSNDTYVYVGFEEVNASASESTIPQVEVTSPKVGGRVNVAVIASRDGTRGYDPNTTSQWATNYGTGGSFLTIGKVQRFNNLHIVDLDTPPTSGGMTRGPYGSDGSPVSMDSNYAAYNLGNAACQSVTYFEYPLGNAKSGGTYTFNKVIQYDPQGIARIQTSTNSDTISKLIEIGLQQTHGTTASTLSNLLPPGRSPPYRSNA